MWRDVRYTYKNFIPASGNDVILLLCRVIKLWLKLWRIMDIFSSFVYGKFSSKSRIPISPPPPIRGVAAVIVLLWLVSQLVAVVLCWDLPAYSDSAAYRQLALESEPAGWYPLTRHLHSENYIFNPGYVNFLILYLKVFGTFCGIGIVNICLNCILLWAIYDITARLAIRKASYLAVIFFCILPSNILVSAVTMSDLFFATLIYAAISLFRRNPWAILVAGLLAGMANYVRPIALLFVVSMLLYAIVKRYRVVNLLLFFGGMLAVTALVGLTNSRMTGETFVSGSTAGVNLIMGANPDADGSYNDEVFTPGHIGYIGQDGCSVFQKDSIWKSRAVEWIKENPAEYAGRAPVKLARLWLGDSYHDLVLSPQRWPSWLKALTSLPYYFVCIMAFVGLWRRRREILGVWGIYLLPVLGVSAMHMLLYGGMRYHYPFIPVIILFATQAFCRSGAPAKEIR